MFTCWFIRRFIMPFALAIFFYTNTSAQISDSLYKALPIDVRPRSKTLLSQEEKIKIASGTSGDIAVTYYKEIHAVVIGMENELSTTIQSQATKVLYAEAIAAFYLNSSHYTRALSRFLQLAQYAGNNPLYSHQLAEANIFIGSLYTVRSQQDSAIYYLQKGLIILGNQHDSLLLQNAYNGYRAVYEKLHLYKQAIEYCNKAISFVKEKDIWKDDYTTFIIAKADLYNNLYNEEKQKRYADSALRLIDKVIVTKKDAASNWYAYCYFLLGQFQLWNGNYKVALQLLDTSLLPKYIDHSLYYEDLDNLVKLYRAVCMAKLGNQEGVQMLESVHIGKTYYKHLQLRNKTLYENAKAAGNWKAAMEYYESYVQNTDSLKIISQRGKVFEAEQKYAVAQKEATIATLKVARLADSLKMSTQQKNLLEIGKKYLIAQQQALVSTLEKRNLADSIVLINQKERTFRAEQKFAAIQKEKAIATLQNKNLQEKNAKKAMAIGLLSLLLFSLVFIALLYLRNKRQQSKRKKEGELLTEKLQSMEKEIHLQRVEHLAEEEKALLVQRKNISRNMHDQISNSVATLRFLIKDQLAHANNNETKQALAMLDDETDQVYLEVRDFMHRLHKAEISNDYNVEDFLQNLSVTFGNGSSLVVSTTYDGALKEENFTTTQQTETYLFIKEAVTNCMKHAEATKLSIKMYLENGNCCIAINDNGKGMQNTGMGIGLASMKERMQALDGQASFFTDNGLHILGRFPLMMIA